MTRRGFVIGLEPAKVDEYKRLHAAVWPEVLATLSRCNVRNYSIFLEQLDEGRPRLFAYFEYVGEDYDADMRRIASDPATREWWTLTAPCQRPLGSRDAGDGWSPLEEVFHHD